MKYLQEYESFDSDTIVTEQLKTFEQFADSIMGLSANVDLGEPEDTFLKDKEEELKDALGDDKKLKLVVDPKTGKKSAEIVFKK
jgi:hypothetical protein